MRANCSASRGQRCGRRSPLDSRRHRGPPLPASKRGAELCVAACGVARYAASGYAIFTSRPVVDVLGVGELLVEDELAATLDILAHQPAELLLGRHRVV